MLELGELTAARASKSSDTSKVEAIGSENKKKYDKQALPVSLIIGN